MPRILDGEILPPLDDGPADDRDECQGCGALFEDPGLYLDGKYCDDCRDLMEGDE